MSFCHLHIHDQYSLLDGFGSAEQYAERAAEIGQEYIALTNHGNVDGALKFQRACAEAGVKPVFGAELYIVRDASVKEKGERRLHLTCLVENEDGWQNLMQMVTLANLEGFYWRPRVDPSIVLPRTDGLFFMTACVSSVLQEEWGRSFVHDLINECEIGRVLGEIMPHRENEQYELNRKVVKFCKANGIEPVATNDCHYPRSDDALLQEVLLAIQRHAKWNDPNRWRFRYTGLYLRTEDEMREAFDQQEDLLDEDTIDTAIEITTEVARICSDGFPKIPERKVQLPKVEALGNEDDTEAMWRIVDEGWDELIEGKTPKSDHKGKDITKLMYADRVDEEMDIICDLGFQRYFLIVWELIDWCRKNDVMTGPGRGSVGGSLVAYLMRITKVDPLVHGLVFSRFISPARIDLPDIDMDFEDRKRKLVWKHLEEMYGKECVAGVSTFATLKGKAALRDVGRVFDLPYADIDKAAKSIVRRSMGDDRADYTIEDAFETFEDGKRFKTKYPREADIAMRIESQVRGAGQHAAGIVVSAEPLTEGLRCTLAQRNKAVVANWDKHDVEHFGLMKLDVLGLSALSVLSDAREMILENRGHTIVYESIPLDDPEVFAEISAGHTVGAFQLSSFGLRKFCAELGVDRFDDIVDATSLWRPGTLRSGTAMDFKRRKNGDEEWEHIHPSMAEMTEDTYGIILYQEQIMRMCYDLAGMTWQNCDLIRKVVAKSQGDTLFAKYKEMFVEGCRDRKTLDEEAASKVWDDLKSFGSYGFNKSHAVEYSMITYWDMWLKVRYPAEFLAASLTHCHARHKDELVREARRLGLKIVPPKVSTSEPDRWVARDDKLLMPLREVKGIGPKACEKIRKMRTNGSKQRGFFFGEKEADEQLPSNYVTVLRRVHAFDDEKTEFTEDEVAEISDLFDFDMSQDPMREVRGIRDLMEPHLRTVKQIEKAKKGTSGMVAFGRIERLRYSYRKSVKATMSGRGEYGGVYGYLRDETGVQMITFSSELYRRKKEAIEHCDGEWVVAEVQKAGADMIHCDEIWLEDELKSANFEDLDVRLVTEASVSDRLMNSIKACRTCELRNECGAPVAPDSGSANVMMIGEAPGKDEDRNGLGFVGAAGQLVWKSLAKHGIVREDIHVTNVVKCWPSQTRTPTTKQIKQCSSQWLDAEVEQIQPALILAFGNTSLRWLRGQPSGIFALNGTVEWLPSLGCWVAWCLHPASALHGPENRRPFLEGIKSFSRAYGAVSGRTKPSNRLSGGDSRGRRKVSGQEAGLAAKRKALARHEKGASSELGRIRFAMRELAMRSGKPVSTDDAREWAEANDVELTSKQWGAVFNRKRWKFVGTASSRIESNKGHRIMLWRPL